MGALYLIPGFLAIGCYLVAIGMIDDRRRKTSFAVTLRAYTPSEWRRSVRELGRQSGSAPYSHSGIDDVPTVFLLAEKMRLESAERMRPFIFAMTLLLFAGEASVMLTQGLDGVWTWLPRWRRSYLFACVDKKIARAPSPELPAGTKVDQNL